MVAWIGHGWSKCVQEIFKGDTDVQSAVLITNDAHVQRIQNGFTAQILYFNYFLIF
jgi:hypothetical protein